MKSFPFDSQITGTDEETGLPLLDRAQSAKVLQQLYEQLYMDGIFQNFEECMKVSPGTGMNVLVNAGGGCCGGSIFLEEEIRTLALQASDMSLDRIDAVVVRKDNNTSYRNTDLYIVTGTPATTPVAPEPTRDDSVHEIVLAHLFVAAGTTAITAQRITDTRLNTELCGIATPMERVDTTGIFEQYQAALDEYLETVAAALDGTLAGNLQNQIGTLDNLKTTVKDSVVNAINWLMDKLYSIVGETDISEIGDGTATGAIAELNRNYQELSQSMEGGTLVIDDRRDGSERVIGKYIAADNKIYPLYRTARFTNSSPVTLESGCQIVRVEGFMKHNTGSDFYLLPYSKADDTATTCITNWNNNVLIFTHDGIDWSNYTTLIYIEYIKTGEGTAIE